MDGLTLEDALERKKLFIVDYKTADGVYSKEGFHVRYSGFLVEWLQFCPWNYFLSQLTKLLTKLPQKVDIKLCSKPTFYTNSY